MLCCRHSLLLLLCLHLLLLLLLSIVKLEKVAELIILSLIDQILAINLTKLIIVAADFYFLCHQTFKSIVMTLNNQSVNSAEVVTASLIA